MSGKSTFLRTILLNVILSQNLNTCFSDEFSLPFSQVYSSISTQDNIAGGASLFYVELSLINEMIHSNDESIKLLLIDEIFKGTNSIERQSLALATLRYLKSKSNIIVISTTHDIEIATLLREDFDLYYLSNYIKNGEMFFDHFFETWNKYQY